MNFQPTITFSQYPKSYAEADLTKNPLIISKLKNQKIDFELIKQVVLAVNIYYDQLGYMDISQDAKMEMIDLFSNLGRLFGLFMGGSFLSCIEIIEFLIELIIILFSKAKISVNDSNDSTASTLTKNFTSKSEKLNFKILNASNMNDEMMSKNKAQN
jgi:uncharacterized membrane protein (Fun14 family)